MRVTTYNLYARARVRYINHKALLSAVLMRRSLRPLLSLRPRARPASGDSRPDGAPLADLHERLKASAAAGRRVAAPRSPRGALLALTASFCAARA